MIELASRRADPELSLQNFNSGNAKPALLPSSLGQAGGCAASNPGVVPLAPALMPFRNFTG